MLTRKRYHLDLMRDHLIHVLPTLQVSGSLALVVDLAQALPMYHHTVVHETPLPHIDPDTLVYAQAVGCDVVQTAHLTAEQLESLKGSAAIFYNAMAPHHVGLGEVLPSINYAYGWWQDIKTDITISCSDYAAHTDRAGHKLELSTEFVVPPMVNTRMLRCISAPEAPFTVGLLTSGSYEKYPCQLAMYLLGKLPADTQLFITRLPTYTHPGVPVAFDAARRRRLRVVSCGVHPSGGVHYTVRTDVLVYGSAATHYEPYGRLVVEAMAMGKAVVVERRGCFADMLQHGVNALLFDTPEEALDHVARLRRDTRLRAALGANAQLWASWQDLSVHIGRMKRILRMIGA